MGCNIVRYLSALICIQLVSLTNLYIISISPPLDGIDNNGGATRGKNRNEQAITPAAQEQVERDKGKTVEQIIAERDLIQAKLNQARRQNMLKDRKLRSLEQQQQQQQQGGGEQQSTDNNNDNNDNDKSSPPEQQHQLAQIRQQLDELQQKHDDKDRKLRLAKDELKSTYSNFLLHVPETGGRRSPAQSSSNSNNDNNNGDGGDNLYESSDHAPLLNKLQQHRIELKSALTKYRVCHHSNELLGSDNIKMQEDESNEDEDEEGAQSTTAAILKQSETTSIRGAGRPAPLVVDEVFDTWEGCWLHTMEKSAFSFKPARRFVVVRNPLNHVPSLYQHCRQQQQQKASGNTAVNIVPATMDEWLDGERELQNSRNNINNATLVDECAQARVPANPQARRVLHGLPAGLDEEFALQNLYDTVGLTDELSKTACLISISIHRRVPPQCDCTATATDDDADDDDSVGDSNNQNNDPSFLDYDEPPVVLTERQRQAIAARTTQDQRLYDVATRLFWDHVARVERVYSFRMC